MTKTSEHFSLTAMMIALFMTIALFAEQMVTYIY
jgi:hypothetical protein